MENETRPVRAVIYDMDGVIIDSEPVYKAIEMGFYNELGITLTQERLIGSIGRSALEWWTEIGEEFALDIDPQELTDRENQAYQDFLDDPERIKPLIPDFPETVRKLSDRNIKIGVASGSAKNSIGKVLRLADPNGIVDAWISAEDEIVENGKPAPDVFLHAAALLGVAPEDCVVVEDSANGILAARNAGMRTVGFHGASDTGQDTSAADYVVSSHLELTALPLFTQAQ